MSGLPILPEFCNTLRQELIVESALTGKRAPVLATLATDLLVTDPATVGQMLQELLNLSAQPEAEIALLSSTPASGVLRSCRYHLNATEPDDFERLVQVFRAHEIDYFSTLAAAIRWIRPAKSPNLLHPAGWMWW